MQVVLPLDVETIIPEDDSVRTLMRIAERINYTKLSGAYERENPRVVWRKEVEKKGWPSWHKNRKSAMFMVPGKGKPHYSGI